MKVIMEKHPPAPSLVWRRISLVSAHQLMFSPACGACKLQTIVLRHFEDTITTILRGSEWTSETPLSQM